MASFNSFRFYTDDSGNLVIAHLKHQKVGYEAGNGEEYIEDARIVLGADVFTLNGEDIIAPELAKAENVAAVDAETATAATNAAAINDILEALKTAGIMEADPEPEE